jgi:hypothetical protein
MKAARWWLITLVEFLGTVFVPIHESVSWMNYMVCFRG